MNTKRLLLWGVMVVLLVLAVALPHRKRARSGSLSPTMICISNLRLIDSAKGQLALDGNLKSGDVVTMESLKRYMGRGEEGMIPVCPLGGTYTANPVGVNPVCSLAAQWHRIPDESPVGTNQDVRPK